MYETSAAAHGPSSATGTIEQGAGTTYTRRTPGLQLGVLLVSLGAVLLAVQMIPDGLFVQWWPLLVIVVGVVQLVTPDPLGRWGMGRIADGLGTMLIGAVLLGCTLGFVGWSMWLTLLGLWPVLIIAAGFHVLGKAVGQSWLAMLAPAIIWAALLYSAGTAWTGAFGLYPLPMLGIESPIVFTIRGL